MEWRKIKLSNEKFEELENAEKQVSDPWLLKRIQCIKLKHLGWKHKDVLVFLRVTMATVSTWIKIYTEKGLAEMLQFDYKGKVSILTLENQKTLKAKNKEKPFQTAKEVKAYIKEIFGIELHLHYVQKLLKKNFDVRTRK